MLPRIVPVLLIEHGAAIHSTSFGPGSYLGDPLNIARLFSNLGADELLVLDRTKGRKETALSSGLLERISRQVACPVSYGGGLRGVGEVRAAFRAGADKVVFRCERRYSSDLISWASSEFGSQSVVGCINYWFREPRSERRLNRELDYVVGLSSALSRAGVGEILLQNVARIGSRSGLDFCGPKRVLDSVQVPVVISGGASSAEDIDAALGFGYSAVAVSTLFSLDKTTDAPLVSYFSETARRSLGWI